MFASLQKTQPINIEAPCTASPTKSLSQNIQVSHNNILQKQTQERLKCACCTAKVLSCPIELAKCSCCTSAYLKTQKTRC
jgi:hypothetical protein